MKDASKVDSGSDEISMGTRSRRNRRSSGRGEIASPLTSSNNRSNSQFAPENGGSDDKAKTKQTTDRNSEEGEKRNHFTRSRNPKPSTPRIAKSEGGTQLQNTPTESRSDDRPNISINACAIF